MSLIAEQPENAADAMLVTPSGIVIDVRPEQLENVEYPMLVTLSGIATDVNAEQPENALSAIPRIPGNSRRPDNELVYPTAHPSTSLTPKMLVVSNSSSGQLLNALFPMLVTLSGIVIDVNAEQPENMEDLMFVEPCATTALVID